MSSIELTEYARGGGKTEKDPPIRGRCAVPGTNVWGCGALAEFSQQLLRLGLR
jgi:hypothetical protein